MRLKISLSQLPPPDHRQGGFFRQVFLTSGEKVDGDNGHAPLTEARSKQSPVAADQLAQ